MMVFLPGSIAILLIFSLLLLPLFLIAACEGIFASSLKVIFWVYRDFVHFLSPALTSLFNRGLYERIFASSLKVANVTPVNKCPRPRTAAQYRPISILPVLSKVLEKIVLYEFLLPCTSPKINLSQFAYIRRAGSGTIPALVSMQNMILKHLDSPGPCSFH